MKIFKWNKGRLPNLTHLWMPLIWSKKLCFDMFMIKFPEGSYIPFHTDPPRKNSKHYRINIIIKKAKKGGEFITKKPNFNWKNRIFIFRADTNEHSVTKIEKGQRLVLSFGFHKLI